MSDLTLAQALQRLSDYRTTDKRASQEIFDAGFLVLQKNAAGKMGEEGWAFLEQLALASIDIGRLDVADRCLHLLSDKFPDSPRVGCLTGIRMEASQPADVVLQYYDGLLRSDPTNGAVWKRKVSVLRRSGKTERAVEELSRFLDTFYSDVEGWLELADIYSSCNQYTYALQSLSHALLLIPQNPFYFQHAAEIAYTAGDVPLALNNFLLVIDMTHDTDSPSPSPESSIPTGITVRAWYGVKLCARRLLNEPRLANTSPSETPPPKHLALIDELATERLLKSYSIRDGEKPPQGKSLVTAWMSTS